LRRSNFLVRQYEATGGLAVNHNYLTEQFSDYDEIFRKIALLVERGDYTLGTAVADFETRFAEIAGVRFALGVGSGTDALFLSLKAIGVKPGDEVITTPYTFFATIGAIVTAGATPVFVDVKDDYNIDPAQIADAITQKTKAILPVHWSGYACDMDELLIVADEHGLHIIEDACHGIKAAYKGTPLGSFGVAGCFSMHPLKNLNVWGDGGVIVTNDEGLYAQLSLMRNHGLINRDECTLFGYNSRLDTIQAIVANHMLDKIDSITKSRQENSLYFDERLAEISQITVPERDSEKQHVFHIYVVRAERRDDLQAFLVGSGIDAKVHYPVPMHLQPAAQEFGYSKGAFPRAEAICDSVISLPVHEFITRAQQDFVVDKIKEFYG
jgi:dTDP-4-amino-4,6-dideoxygalactose transaminase